jgi:hypothetical protein
MTYTINHKRTGCELLKYGEEGECTLIDAELTNTDLRGADLRGANLRGANLTGANLYGADLTGVDLTHGANLTDADLSGADLGGADLTGADLTGADLTDATLSGANLTKANLRQVWVCVGTRLHHQPNIIDLGADNRGYRFWAWHDTQYVVYRAGCREWYSHESAIAHYDEDKYTGTGDRVECIRRMHVIRGWAMQWI